MQHRSLSIALNKFKIDWPQLCHVSYHGTTILNLPGESRLVGFHFPPLLFQAPHFVVEENDQ